LYIIDTISTINRIYVALAPLSSYISGLLASFPMRIINKRLGRKPTIILGLVFILSSTVLFWFIYELKDKRYLEISLISACVLLGIGTSTTSICSFSLTSDLIGLNTECGSFVYGIMSFADKLANGIVIAIIQQFNPCTSSSTTKCSLYYRYMLTFIPVGASVLTILMLLSMWNTTVGENRRQTIPEGENVPHTTTVNSSENEYSEQSSLLT
jgi:MFS family permease